MIHRREREGGHQDAPDLQDNSPEEQICWGWSWSWLRLMIHHCCSELMIFLTRRNDTGHGWHQPQQCCGHLKLIFRIVMTLFKQNVYLFWGFSWQVEKFHSLLWWRQTSVLDLFTPVPLQPAPAKIVTCLAAMTIITFSYNSLLHRFYYLQNKLNYKKVEKIF